MKTRREKMSNEAFPKRRINEASRIFDETKELFEDDSKKIYITTILTKDEMDSLLEELIACFTHIEDFAKCKRVYMWKKTLID
jgi:hypothetical protein